MYKLQICIFIISKFILIYFHNVHSVSIHLSSITSPEILLSCWWEFRISTEGEHEWITYGGQIYVTSLLYAVQLVPTPVKDAECMSAYRYLSCDLPTMQQAAFTHSWVQIWCTSSP